MFPVLDDQFKKKLTQQFNLIDVDNHNRIHEVNEQDDVEMMAAGENAAVEQPAQVQHGTVFGFRRPDGTIDYTNADSDQEEEKHPRND